MADYIPNSDPVFDDFQEDLIDYIDTNNAAWGIPNADVNALKAEQTPWTDTWAVAKNKGSRSSADVQAKNNARDEYEKAIRDFVNEHLYYNKNVTDAQRVEMGITVRDTEPTDRPAITVTPYVNLQAEAGALLKITCRTDSDSSRPSRHPDANNIEIKYKIGGDEPLSPADTTKSATFSKAIYTLRLNVADAGKRIYCFVRWVNTSDPSKSGPWSIVLHVVITN